MAAGIGGGYATTIMYARVFRALWPFLLLFGLSFVVGCDKRGDEASKDERTSSDDDDDSKSKKKKKKSADAGSEDDEPAKKSAVEGTTFTPKKPSVGDKRTATQNKKMVMAIDVDGNKSNLTSDEQVEANEEVLAVENGLIMKLKVTYTKAFKDEKKPKGGTTGAKPTEGKTYVVEKKGDDVVVTDEAGAAVPKDEEEIVIDDHDGSLGKPDPFMAGFPTRPLKKGERVTELEVALQAYFIASTVERSQKKGKDGPSFTDFEVTFRGVEGDIGLFDMKMKLAGDESGVMHLDVPFVGTLKVRVADAWPHEIKLEGNMTMTPAAGASGPLATLSGAGTMSMDYRFAYP